jgi:Shikimate kinase
MNGVLPSTADGHGAEERVVVTTLPYPHPIFLVGMMGAGKTTIGRALARAVDREFLDLDHEIEARCGVRVAHIFDVEGEEGFRKRERMVLDECTSKQAMVMATGGGAVLAPENRDKLRSRGVVVYLRATPEELYRRVARDRNRPLLQTENPQGRIRELVAAREPLYEEVAHIVFDTGSMPVHHVVKALLPVLKAYKVEE